VTSLPALEGRIESVRFGAARERERPKWDHTPGARWKSGYVKDEAAGPVRVGRLGLEGDEQVERDVHGGPDRAVLAYAFDHYPRWREELKLPEMGPGGFAENLTVRALDERRVCLGDRYRAGSALLEVAQPRGPCENISRHWNRPDMVRRVAESARGGWYMRVIEEGVVRIGDRMTLTERPYEGWTVERVFRIRMDPDADRGEVEWLERCAQLSSLWRDKFSARLTR
jgi:MOSC domain-containing protein YiiM